MDARKPLDRRDEIGALLQQFSAVSEDLGRAFAARHGMDHTAARAIVELMEASESGTPMAAGLLGARLDLSPASVTALVDRMVRAGHVRREPDPGDRRRILLRVQESAVDLGEQFFRPLAEDLVSMMAGYSDAELDLIRDFLSQATGTVRRHLTRAD